MLKIKRGIFIMRRLNLADGINGEIVWIGKSLSIKNEAHTLI